MNSERATFLLRLGYSAATAAMVLVGASLNATGRSGLAAFLGIVAGLLAFGSGALNKAWQGSVPLGVAALLVTLLAAGFDLGDSNLVPQVAGLVLLGLGGFVGSIAYRSFAAVIGSHARELEGVRVQLLAKERAFMAATADADHTKHPGDMAAFANIAREAGADFACYYASSPDGKQFVPQPPGIGLDRIHPMPVQRHAAKAGPLLTAIEAGREYIGNDQSGLSELVHYLPEELQVARLMAVPMRIGDQIGGFILLGKKTGEFRDDDRRLAVTLTLRAGAQLASAHAVAISRRESARYSLMNELIKDASGKTMEETLQLVLEKGKQVIRYDSGSAILFQPDGTYFALGAEGVPEEVQGALVKVRGGEAVLRSLITADEPIYSGLNPDGNGGGLNEALTPIHGNGGVIGALCLGRTGAIGFAQGELGSLDELGSMAAVVLENSRILQAVTGHASKLDTALDA
ncbi:MAG TPA: GAF domain-containing protein, partial [Candidatus Acidoferrum sp.]|nr:GAF domain-containing protein [Candidatus Acidoferrum sp.]